MRFVLFAAALALSGCVRSPAARARDESVRAPDFTLTDTEGHQLSLHDLLRRGPVILAFFPKAFTAG
jgi:hypothetical protein